MQLKEHVILSTVSSGAVYIVSGSPAFAAGSFLIGIFIDLDHFLDYFLNFGFRIDIKDFFEKCTGYQMRNFYVLLHSYELAVLLALLNLLYPSKIGWGILFGFTLHIFADSLNNKVHPLSYFLIFRYLKKFNSQKMFKPPYGNA